MSTQATPVNRQARQDTLERLIDTSSLHDVLVDLAQVCWAKEQHVQEAWQDNELAKRWNRAANACMTAAGKVDL